MLSAAGTGPAERILPWTYSPNKSFQRKTQRKGLGNKAEPPEEITLGGRFLASRADAHELQHDPTWFQTVPSSSAPGEQPCSIIMTHKVGGTPWLQSLHMHMHMCMFNVTMCRGMCLLSVALISPYRGGGEVR